MLISLNLISRPASPANSALSGRFVCRTPDIHEPSYRIALHEDLADLASRSYGECVDTFDFICSGSNTICNPPPYYLIARVEDVKCRDARNWRLGLLTGNERLFRWEGDDPELLLLVWYSLWD